MCADEELQQQQTLRAVKIGLLLGFWFLPHFSSVFAFGWLKGTAYILSLSSSPSCCLSAQTFHRCAQKFASIIFHESCNSIMICHHTCAIFLLKLPAFQPISPHVISSLIISCTLTSHFICLIRSLA